MHKYELGGYFHGHPKAFQEGCTLLYDNSGPALVISLPGLTSEETKHIQKGQIDFGVFEEEGILFLLIKIPGVLDWSDAPFHIGLYSDGRQVPEEIPESKGWGLTIIGLEAKNGQIKALRYVGLGTEISREMIRIIRKQGRTNHVEHYNKLKQIYRKYSCEDMANKATARYQVGGRL